jgi:hypothetical protein
MSLKVVVLCIESSDTLHSGVAQTWTLWCGARCPPLRGQSRRQRMASEFPKNPSMKNPSPDVEVAVIQPYDAHHSPLASSLVHSKWSIVAQG